MQVTINYYKLMRMPVNKWFALEALEAISCSNEAYFQDTLLQCWMQGRPGLMSLLIVGPQTHAVLTQVYTTVVLASLSHNTTNLSIL